MFSVMCSEVWFDISERPETGRLRDMELWFTIWTFDFETFIQFDHHDLIGKKTILSTVNCARVLSAFKMH